MNIAMSVGLSGIFDLKIVDSRFRVDIIYVDVFFNNL